MSEPCTSGEMSAYKKMTPTTSKDPDSIWCSPKETSSNTSNEAYFTPPNYVEDINLVDQVKLTSRSNRQSSSVFAVTSKHSFHSSIKFSPRNDNFSIMSQKTGKGLSYRESRPTSGSICKRRVNKYGLSSSRCQARKVSDMTNARSIISKKQSAPGSMNEVYKL